MSHLSLIPAYGRDYKSKAEVLADWFADKDFLSVGYGSGGYVNRSQVMCDVNIRYKRQTLVCVIPFGMKPPKTKAPAPKVPKVAPTLRTAYDYETEEAPDDYFTGAYLAEMMKDPEIREFSAVHCSDD